ncbi:MAG: tRNA 2-thiouridine(34) synthase MnmA, partial [Alphaproteobacteria bacterium]|nr:tRNA 2-thiouridine(34) synthase MnmA [Alphaproteobacteria bacterium]
MNVPINSLGFDRIPAETRVVVAMSGGVDSAVTAAMLADQGYDVVGITLQLYDHGETVVKPGTCCASEDIQDARRVADHIGIPHYVLNYESRFRESVIEDFADSYIQGETPIPCIRCNQTVKFRDLLDTAMDIGADVLATGHYVRRADGTEGPELLKAADPSRDQSYFLFATTRPQLDLLRFPLGDMKKTSTRGLARKFRLPISAKPDSQDICFVPDGDYGAVVAKLRPGASRPGDIVAVDGSLLGRHDGVIHYTVGQRKGLGIGGMKGGDGAPFYVVDLDPEVAQVTVGPLEVLKRARLRVREVNWLGPGARIPLEGMTVSVKLRSAQPPAAATLYGRKNGAEVVLETPQA